MNKIFSLVIMVMLLSGCSSLPKILSYNLPQDYKLEFNRALEELNNIGLQHKYSVQFLNDQDFIKKKEFKLAYIDGTTIYIDEFYFKYLHWWYSIAKKRKAKWTIRQEYLCLLAHEIAHTETGLSDTPIETHLTVDRKAIEYCGYFRISHCDYAVALFILKNCVDERKRTLSSYIFEGTGLLLGVTTGVGWTYYENDLYQRWTEFWQGCY